MIKLCNEMPLKMIKLFVKDAEVIKLPDLQYIFMSTFIWIQQLQLQMNEINNSPGQESRYSYPLIEHFHYLFKIQMCPVTVKIENSL